MKLGVVVQVGKGNFVEKLRKIFRRTHFFLLLERLWPRLWPILGLGFIFFIFVLFDIMPNMPFFMHLAFLCGFFCIGLFLLYKLSLVDLEISSKTINSRLSLDNNLAHRPWDSLDDKNVFEKNTSESSILWETHRKRITAQLTELRVKLPSFELARHDPYALRIALGLLFFIGLGVGGSQFIPRLERAILPTIIHEVSEELGFEVWITPPQYSNSPSVILKAAKEIINKSNFRSPDHVKSQIAKEKVERIPILQGSRITANVYGIQKESELVLGSRRIEALLNGEQNKEEAVILDLEVKLLDSGAQNLSLIVDAKTIASWPIKILKDNIPNVEFLEPPKRVGRANFQLKTEARDDFSVESLWGVVLLPQNEKKSNDKIELQLNVRPNGLGNKKVRMKSEHNLSSHPWAGSEVNIQFFAQDDKGQIGQSETISMIIPQRVFNHPVSQALVDARKKLNYVNSKVIETVIEKLSALNSKPEHFFNNTQVFLNITIAKNRLLFSNISKELSTVQDILWKTALLVEDGDYAVADKELADIWEEVEKAFISESEKNKVNLTLDQLRVILKRYLSSLMKHVKSQGLDSMLVKSMERAIKSNDLFDLLDRAQSMAKMGSMDIAQKMISELKQMIGNIRNGINTARPNPWAKAAQKIMGNLRGLAKRQQGLIDQTYQNRRGIEDDYLSSRENKLGYKQIMGDGSKKTEELKLNQSSDGSIRAQKKLREELEEVILEIKENMGTSLHELQNAGKAMKEAEKALRDNDNENLIKRQMEALAHLQDGIKNTISQITKKVQNKYGSFFGQQLGGTASEMREGPFGRSLEGGGGQFGEVGETKIPTNGEVHRARKIFDELSRRAGEHQRSIIELEFLNRLLKRF